MTAITNYSLDKTVILSHITTSVITPKEINNSLLTAHIQIFLNCPQNAINMRALYLSPPPTHTHQLGSN